MRRTVIAIALLSGCSQRSITESGAFDPADIVHETDDAIRVEVHRKDVPLAEMPVVTAALGGLPMSGMATVDIDITVPKRAGIPRYRETTGSIALACPADCTLGDDRAELALEDLGSIAFGHLGFDSIELRARIANGKAELTAWKLVSDDLVLDGRVRIELADDLDASTVEGCLWFAETPGLVKRDPKTAAVIQTTGATKNRDGKFSIKVGGTIGNRKYLAQECGAI